MALRDLSLPIHATPPSMSFLTACSSLTPSADSPTRHNEPLSPFWGRMFSTVFRPCLVSLSLLTLQSVFSTLTWALPCPAAMGMIGILSPSQSQLYCSFSRGLGLTVRAACCMSLGSELLLCACRIYSRWTLSRQRVCSWLILASFSTSG